MLLGSTNSLSTLVSQEDEERYLLEPDYKQAQHFADRLLLFCSEMTNTH